ncbi:MAG: hypothetical protein HQ564_09420 [Candidatus Saganbacteria bacterium]|nr:hypothetical protein [Candidatus Saganbacteria bacterium]
MKYLDRLNDSEIRQLWVQVEYYMFSGDQKYYELKKIDVHLVKLAQKKIGKKYMRSFPHDSVLQLTIALGYFSSAAVRLYSIEDQLERVRFRCHREKERDIFKNGSSNKRGRLIRYYLDNLCFNIDILLRLNCAHSEEPKRNYDVEKTKARQEVLMRLSLAEIKNYMHHVYLSMEDELQKRKII